MEDMEETSMYITNWKKSIWKDCIFPDPKHMTLWKRQNYQDSKTLGLSKGSREGRMNRQNMKDI
jgi:hypothetical protein